MKVATNRSMLFYRKYRDTKFKEWKHKVYLRLPALCKAFYELPERNYKGDLERKMGAVIQQINDPYTAITTGPNGTGEVCDERSKIAMQIIFKLVVNEVFKGVYSA